MPTVHIDMFEGRTIDQKRDMVKKVTEAIVSSLNVTPDVVTIIINDMAYHNYAKGGVLRLDWK